MDRGVGRVGLWARGRSVGREAGIGTNVWAVGRGQDSGVWVGGGRKEVWA
jgi:hypothetical protein